MTLPYFILKVNKINPCRVESCPVEIDKLNILSVTKNKSLDMKKILILISTLNLTLVSSQELTKKETIDYINKNLDKTQVSINSIGVITIKDIGIFNYKDVEMDFYPFHPFQIHFKCKKNDECIEDPKYNPKYEYPKEKYTNMIRLILDDKEDFRRMKNAFDYFFKLLNRENFKKNNKDPFSPENYNKD